MIYVFSNRNIIKNGTWLGDEFNSESNENLRVAQYTSSPQPKLTFYSLLSKVQERFFFEQYFLKEVPISKHRYLIP